MIELRDAGLRGERTQSASGDPQAWKRLIGTRPVEARLETLPDNKLRRGAFALSSAVQLTLALVVISLPLIFPEQISIRAIYQVTPIEAPQTEVPVQPEKPEVRKRPEPTPVKPPEPVRVAKLFAPQPLVAPKPKPLEKVNADVPKLEPVIAHTKFDTSSRVEPERPREPVKTGMLNTDKAPEPTLKAASDKVQTGGFGDPQGFAGGAPEAKHGNVARLGSFELPSGPGYGNGTGGASGARGIVASAGFANNSVGKAAPSNRGAVQSGGFGTVDIAPAAKAAQKHVEEAAIQPVVILSKPNPLYTDEARKLGIEGEVLVEVNFLASGQVRSVRVVKGLGHGLDEAALHAAEQIRFKPALQEGHAVDFPAIAHIIFQLAY